MHHTQWAHRGGGSGRCTGDSRTFQSLITNISEAIAMCQEWYHMLSAHVVLSTSQIIITPVPDTEWLNNVVMER